MKQRLHTIGLLWALTAGLLFSQIGAGYFHNKHDAHKNTHILPVGKFAIQQHGEHCKLCAIDLITLYHEALQISPNEEPDGSIFVGIVPVNPPSSCAASKGRSPPSIS
jgi:hypothetical protein